MFMTPRRSVAGRLAAVVALALALVVGMTGQALAGEDADYGNTETEEGPDGTDNTPVDNGGEPAPPPCNLSEEFDVCFGTLACWVRDPALAPESLDLAGPKPSEDARMGYRQCEDRSYEWYWLEEGEGGPSLADRIRSARGSISIPAFTATFNPPGRTIVNIDTWWWADGVPAGEIVGTEALGLRAVATRRSMTVDPGDGSAQITCPITASKSDACSHTYRRSSGSDTYEATVTVVYDLRFEEDGQAVGVPDGLPADLLTLEREESVLVPVREIQSTVTGIG